MVRSVDDIIKGGAKNADEIAGTAADAAAKSFKGGKPPTGGLPPTRKPKLPEGAPTKTKADADAPPTKPKKADVDTPPTKPKKADEMTEAEIENMNNTATKSDPEEIIDDIAKSTGADPKDVAKKMDDPEVKKVSKLSGLKDYIKKGTKFATENATGLGLLGIVVYSMIKTGESDPIKALGKFTGKSAQSLIESGADAAENIFEGIYNGLKNALGEFMWIFWVFVAVMCIGLLYGLLSVFGIF